MNKPKTLQELFRKKDTWTKGSMARDHDGDAVSVSSKFACRFCLLGGTCVVYAYAMDGRIHILDRLLNTIKDLFPDRVRLYPGYDTISHFNDDELTTIHDVRKVIRKAKV